MDIPVNPFLLPQKRIICDYPVRCYRFHRKKYGHEDYEKVIQMRKELHNAIKKDLSEHGDNYERTKTLVHR